MAKTAKLRWRRMAAFALVIGFGGLSEAAAAGTLDEIRARGALVVGTKADYQPFGFRNAGGNIVGFEPDLAAAIAESLGVAVKLVPVVATNRVSLLNSGDIDLIIATMNDTPERRKQVDFVEPNYYASGVNVLVPKLAHIRVWQQLRGKPVCTVEGVFYIAEIKDRYAPELQILKDITQAYEALKAGRCIAAVYDDAAIIGQLQNADWQDYEMPLRSILVQPWGLAVKQGNTELGAAIGDLVKKWHRTGYIQKTEKTWHIPPSVFAEEMHRRYADAE